jgi:hypothetical protein
MAEDFLYQVTRIGAGFEGKPGQDKLREGLREARQRLMDIEGPYHFRGQPHREYPRPQIMELLEDRWKVLRPVNDSIFVMGNNYDQPGIACRVIHDKSPEEHPYVVEARRFEGQPYVFGNIFPPSGDCSGLVVRVVENVKKVTLPHSSQAIMTDPRLHNVERSELRSGDFIFYNFGRLPYPMADDITICADPDKNRQVGARPSVKPGYRSNGVQFFDMLSEKGAVVRYRRF